jgi:MFS family permease
MLRDHMNPIPASTLRRITATLFVAQALALGALFTSTSLGSITSVHLAGTEEVAGLPLTFALAGAALAAYPAGQLMGRVGRRIGLSTGYAIGIVGGVVGGLGVIGGSLPIFLCGMGLLGAARAVSDQARYAAADVAPAHLRARAVSTIVFAGTVGAVGGPLLAPVVGRIARQMGYEELAGPWFVTATLLIGTLVIVYALLRPDPRDIARSMHAAETEHSPSPALPPRSFAQVMGNPAARLALVSLGLAQTVMVMVMTITPVHMTHFDHGLDEISLVISMHVLGMYGLSIVTGWLTDRWGRRATIGLGSLVLIVACLIAPTNPDTLPLAASLFLLGLGWNMCFVSGSALLTDVLGAHERARIQGAADLVVNLASAAGSLGSGLLIASLGYGIMAAIGAGLTLIIFAFAFRTPQARAVETAAAQ